MHARTRLRLAFVCLLPTGMLCQSVLAAAADGPDSAWLSAADFGASGSAFQTTAAATAGSCEITVTDPGDFRVGQGIMVSKCCVHYSNATLFGPVRTPRRPLEGQVEIRGYDGSSGSWTVFLLDIPPGDGKTFRWTDDLGRTWHEKTPLGDDWQPLSGGTEVRFQPGDWQRGYVVSFSARDQLISTVTKIEGRVLTLGDPANRTVADGVAQHCDDAALQAAVDEALRQRRRLHLPPGRYRLTKGLEVKNPEGFTLQGAGPEHSVLDISEGEGPCVQLTFGTEATIRDLRMVGHTGFDQADQAGHLRVRGAESVWGFYLKPCSALRVTGTERVLVENCHASRMSGECFYSQSPSRSGSREPPRYTKSLTFLRCWVVDSARNAFNNNDGAEGTSVLYCRVVDVGGCSWEGASRFVRIIGNYVRNAGPIAMGNVRSRSADLDVLGRAQHVVADNVFEGRRNYGGHAGGGFMINAGASATQVVVRNNLFVNFNSSGISISGRTSQTDLPAGNALISGNILDLTSQDPESLPRTGIHVGAPDVLISDNQVYVRGQCDPQVTGIQLGEAAVNLNVHDNLLRQCGVGLLAQRAAAAVARVIDSATFLSAGADVPWPGRLSHCYRGWNVAWLSGACAGRLSVMEAFDPETLQFRLREPCDPQPGDKFEIYPVSANWLIHDNALAGCLKPVVLDAHGSETSLVRDNLISTDAAEAGPAMEIHGRFQLSGNQVHGYQEPAP